jgi:hypothetical protein
LQKKVLHIIEGVNKRESCRGIFKKCQVLTVISLHLFEILCHIKNYNVSVKKIHDLNTRGKHDLHIVYCNSSLFKKSVVNMGIRVNSTLPDTKNTGLF